MLQPVFQSLGQFPAFFLRAVHEPGSDFIPDTDSLSGHSKKLYHSFSSGAHIRRAGINLLQGFFHLCIGFFCPFLRVFPLFQDLRPALFVAFHPVYSLRPLEHLIVGKMSNTAHDFSGGISVGQSRNRLVDLIKGNFLRIPAESRSVKDSRNA